VVVDICFGRGGELRHMGKCYLCTRSWQMTVTQASERTLPKDQSDSALLFQQANAEYDAGCFERALELFEAAIASGLSNEVVHNNKGAALDALGRGNEAVESYRRAVTLTPSYELAWHNLGNSLFNQEIYRDAARAYAKAIALNPQRLENISALARAYSKLGRKAKTRAVTDKLTQPAENEPLLLLVQAELYLAADAGPEAIRACEKYVLKHPEDPQGYASLGNAYHALGDYPRAIIEFERAVERSPRNTELWNSLGYSCFCANEFNRAIECFDRAISIDPKHKHAWYNKGYAMHGVDRLEEAVECYKQALAADPTDKVLWNNVGNALYNLGRYGESIPKFVTAIQVDPDYEIAWNNIGNALEKMELWAEAIPFHDRSLEIKPDFDYALYAKGVCKAATGDPEGGYDLILESLDLNPTYDEAWKARSRVARQLGRLDEALMSIEESLAVNPDFDQGWTDRGEILLHMGDIEGAQASFEAALVCLDTARSGYNAETTAFKRKGELLFRLGRYDESLEAFERAAEAGKIDAKMLSRIFLIRRILARPDVPDHVIRACELGSSQEAVAECASFLLDAGNWRMADKVLGLASIDEPNPELVLVKAKVMAYGGNLEGALALLRAHGPSLQVEKRDVFEGEVAESTGNHVLAEESYLRALSSTPSDLSAALSLARVRIKMGKHREAVEAADVAIGIDGREWEPYKAKADALSLLGKEDDAARLNAKARRLLAVTGLDFDSLAGVGRG